jgi:hypothetical protein
MRCQTFGVAGISSKGERGNQLTFKPSNAISIDSVTELRIK